MKKIWGQKTVLKLWTSNLKKIWSKHEKNMGAKTSSDIVP
jgi:hypothetical protein